MAEAHKLTEDEAKALYKATRSPFYTIPTRTTTSVGTALHVMGLVDASGRITEDGRAALARHRGETP